MKYNHKKVISKGRRKKEKVKNEQRYAEKTVNKEDEIQNVLQVKAETVTDLAVDAAQETKSIVKEVHEKIEGAKGQGRPT